MDDASKIQEDLAKLRQQFTPPPTQSVGESPKEPLQSGAPAVTSFAKPMGVRMGEPASAGRKESPVSVTRPAETAAIRPSVPDVSLPQELQDVGIETAPPDTITIHDDIGAMVQNTTVPVSDSLQSTKEVILPRPSVKSIGGVPAALNYLTGLEREDALERIKALKKKEPPKSSKKFLITQVERQIKMKDAKDAGLMPSANSEDIMNQ